MNKILNRVTAASVALLLCVLWMGAAQRPPVLQTTEFFINDAATMLVSEQREALLEEGRNLEADTGCQVVLLTLTDLGGMGLEECAQVVHEGWFLSPNSILIVFAPEGCTMWVGDEAGQVFNAFQQAAILDQITTPSLEEERYAKAVFDTYEAVVAEVSEQLGRPFTPTKVNTSSNKGRLASSISFSGIAMLFFFYTIRKLRRNPERYRASGYTPRRRRNFVREVPDEAERLANTRIDSRYIDED